MSAETDLAIAQKAVEKNVIANYGYIVILTVLVYDIVASCDKEVKYFWRRPGSAVSILYFMNRYSSILAVVLDFLLNSLHASALLLRYLQVLLNIIIILSIDYILILRVNALYSRGRTITRTLLLFFIVEAFAGIALAIQGAVREDYSPSTVAGSLNVCSKEHTVSPAEAAISWSIPSFFGALLMVLALCKAATIWKESAGLKGLSLVKILIRDQAFYFLAVIYICIAQALALTVDVDTMLHTILEVVRNAALLSILGARLLFNMKEAGEKGLNQGMSCNLSSTINEIDFAEGLSYISAASTEYEPKEYMKTGIAV